MTRRAVQRVRGPVPVAPAALSVVRGTTSRLPRRATSSPTTSSAILSRPLQAGLCCRPRTARTVTPTTRRAGRSPRCGAHATTGTWRGVAGAANRSTRRSPARTAGSGTSARYRSGSKGSSGGIQLSLLVFGRRAGRSHRYITDTRPNSPPSRIQGYDKESSARRQCVGYRCGHRHNNTFVRGRASQRRPDAEPPVPNHPSGSGRGACPRTDGTYGRGRRRSAHRGRRTQRRPGRDGDGTAPTLNAGAPLTRAWLQRSTAQVG